MPFAWIEGFDDYPAAFGQAGYGLAAYWFQADGFYPDGPFVAGRFGNRALNIPFSNQGLMRGIPSTTHIAGGFAVRVGNMGVNPVVGNPLIIFASSNKSTQWLIGVDDMGFIRADKSSLAAPLFKSHKPVESQTWVFFEYELELSDTVGRFKLSLNGEVLDEFTATNIDTKGSADADIGRIIIKSPGTNANDTYYDDMYVKYDDSTMIGECRARLLTLTGDDVVQWTKLGGASNASQVGEAQSDGDATYNSSNTVGQQDLFKLAALDGNPTHIYAVQHSLVARKDDAGTRTIAPVLKLAGVTQVLADTYQTSDYTFSRTILETNPATTLAWTKADLDPANLSVGYKLTL